MAEEILSTSEVGEFQALSSFVMSDLNIQLLLAVLSIGLIVIFSVFFRFSKWIKGKKFSYTKPHLARFVQRAVLPLLGIALVSSINGYIQIFELFGEQQEQSIINGLNPKETFAKLLNTINILVIGYTIAQFVPIFLYKREASIAEREDFQIWKKKQGFQDDPCENCDSCNGKHYGACKNTQDLFHKMYKWIPPSGTPDDMTVEEFKNLLKTDEGRKNLEKFVTSSGQPIGSYQSIVDDPFEKWKKYEREKYERYLNFCITGNNAAGRKLHLRAIPREVYAIDNWREMRRVFGYDYVVPGGKPPGYYEQREKSQPKSISRTIPIAIFTAIVLGVAAWWGTDLVIVATATGGLGVGVGLALKETMENYFAYLVIRKDRIVQEGERIQLDSGYNGYIYSITPRVTYLRHPLNESIAIVPTRHLVTAQILNFDKEFQLSPATVKVGVSYLNNPRQVTAILMKVGRRVMEECVDSKGRHMVVQKKCPNLEDNRSSCGCDQNLVVDVEQPVVRFEKFNDSSLDFAVWVYARDYGSQFKIQTEMRLIMYEEFKKYDIRIPWPIRTIYQGDEKKEVSEIAKAEKERNDAIKEYGLGDISSDFDA